MNNRNSAAGWLVVLLCDSEIDMNKKTKKKKKLCGRIWEWAIYLYSIPILKWPVENCFSVDYDVCVQGKTR